MNKYALWGIPLLYEIPFVNEKGLSFSGNAVASETQFDNQSYGSWNHFLDIWTMLNCDTIEDVDAYWRNIRRCYNNIDEEKASHWPNTFDGSATTWSDFSGKIISIEYAGEYRYDSIKDIYQHEWYRSVANATYGSQGEFEHINDDILWHANHLQWINQNENILFNGTDSSIKRSDRAMFLLNDSHGTIDFLDILSIVRDKQYLLHPNWNICRGSVLPNIMGTYTSWIIETEYNHLPSIRWSPGRCNGESPCYYDLAYWHQLNCSDFFIYVDAGGPYFGEIGGTVNLSANTIGGTNPYYYCWDIDNDGEYDDEIGQTIQINISDYWLIGGKYNVNLKVLDNSGKTGTDRATINIILTDIEQNVFDRGFPIRHAQDGDWGGAQTVMPNVDVLTKVELYLRLFGTPSFDLIVELREDGPEGVLLDTITFSPGDLSSSWEWVEVDFADETINSGTEYVIVCPSPPSGVSDSFGYEWGYADGDLYADGCFWFTRDGGTLWCDLPDSYEFTFRTYGYL